MSDNITDFLINSDDVRKLNLILDSGELEEFYKYLSDKGDQYALTAPGSNHEYNFLSRLSFYHDLDVYNDDSRYIYLKYELYKVQRDLAKEYINLLESKLEDNRSEGSYVNVSHEEVMEYYLAVLIKHDMVHEVLGY